MIYDWLTKIDSFNFRNKSIVIDGSGGISKEYCEVFEAFGIKDVSIIGRTKNKVEELCKIFNFSPIIGDYQETIPKIKKVDLVVICLPIHLLLPAAELAVSEGHTKLLIEKPGSIHHADLLSLSKKLNNQIVRIGYQRLLYPNFQKLKELALFY